MYMRETVFPMSAAPRLHAVFSKEGNSLEFFLHEFPTMEQIFDVAVYPESLSALHLSQLVLSSSWQKGLFSGDRVFVFDAPICCCPKGFLCCLSASHVLEEVLTKPPRCDGGGGDHVCGAELETAILHYACIFFADHDHATLDSSTDYVWFSGIPLPQ